MPGRSAVAGTVRMAAGIPLGGAPRAGASNRSGRTAFRQTEAAGTRQQRLGRGDGQDTTRHGDRRHEGIRLGGYFQTRGEEDDGATRVVVAGGGRMLVAGAPIGPTMGPRVGRGAGGQHREHEHQQHSRPGEEPEVQRRESVMLHVRWDVCDLGCFVKREVP